MHLLNSSVVSDIGRFCGGRWSIDLGYIGLGTNVRWAWDHDCASGARPKFLSTKSAEFLNLNLKTDV